MPRSILGVFHLRGTAERHDLRVMFGAIGLKWNDVEMEGAGVGRRRRLQRRRTLSQCSLATQAIERRSGGKTPGRWRDQARVNATRSVGGLHEMKDVGDGGEEEEMTG